MRWLILIFSLLTTLAALYRGIMPLVFYMTNTGTTGMTGLWPVILLLSSSSLFGFMGGVLCFNQRKLGATFLLLASILAYFGYPASGLMALSFATIAVMSFAILHFIDRAERGFNEPRYGRSRLEDEYDEDEDDEEITEYDEDEDEEDEEEVSLKRTSIKYKIPPRRSYSNVVSREVSSMSVKPGTKSKYSKVCMNCGIEVPRDYMFCFACGTKLSDGFNQQYDIDEYRDDADDIDEYQDNHNKQVEEHEEHKEDTRDYRSPQRVDNPAVEVVPVIRKVSAPDIPRNYESDDAPEDIPEEEDVPFRSANSRSKKRSLGVDSSYQSFGRYAQSRKRRKVSILQRVLLGVLGFGIASALGWFMYMGIVKVPPPEPVEVPQPRVTPNTPATEPVKEELAMPEVTTLIPSFTPEAPKQVITTGSVNLRSAHTTSSRILSRLPVNATYELLGQWQAANPAALPAADKQLTDKWYQVKAGKNTGWIYSQYAQTIDGRATSLPSGYTDSLLNSFGLNRSEIESKLGKPARVQTRGDVISLEYPGVRISLRDNKVQSLQVTGKEVTLANGLAVGMTFDETASVLGAPNKNRDGVQLHLETPTRGVVIRRDNDGKIRNINVGSA